MEGKKSFILYLTQRPIFDGLSDEDAGKLIKAIFAYVCDEHPNPSGLAGYSFNIIKSVLKSDLVKYNDKKQKMSENAKKRWEQINANDSKDMQMDAIAYKSKQKDTDIVIDNDIDIVNVIDIDNDIVSKDILLDKNKAQEEPKQKRKVFIAPSVSDVSEYISKMGWTDIDADVFVSYYESRGWMMGSTKIKDWKACCKTWHYKNNPKVSNTDAQTKVQSRIYELDQLDDSNSIREKEALKKQLKDMNGGFDSL